MRDVRPDDINRMMKRVTSYSKSIHDKTYMLAKQIFTNAFENGIISSNPLSQDARRRARSGGETKH